jgi:hypothetical protein
MKPNKDICRKCERFSEQFPRILDNWDAKPRPPIKNSACYSNESMNIPMHKSSINFNSVKYWVAEMDEKFKIPDDCPFILEHTLEGQA